MSGPCRKANWQRPLTHSSIECSTNRPPWPRPDLHRRHALSTSSALPVAGFRSPCRGPVQAAESIGLGDTAERYTSLLESVFLIHRLPAWGTTLRSRVGTVPKVHLRDSGLAARLLGLDAAKLGRLDPSAMTEFGHLFETFCINEILTQLSWRDQRMLTGHWRTHDGGCARWSVIRSSRESCCTRGASPIRQAIESTCCLPTPCGKTAGDVGPHGARRHGNHGAPLASASQAMAANPVSRSAMMSSMLSRPTLSRTRPGVTPLLICSSSLS